MPPKLPAPGKAVLRSQSRQRKKSNLSGMAVGRARIRGRHVVLAVFVLVLEAEVWIFDHSNGLKRSCRIRNRYDSADAFQILRQASLIPDIQLIPPIRDVRNAYPARPVRTPEVRGVNRNNGSAHFRVDVAE